MSINASAGAKLYACATSTPSADDVSAFEALTWIEIGEIESIGEYGDAAAQITFTSLGDSRVRKLKGAYDAGDITVTLAHDPTDAGQLALKTMAAAKFSYPFKVALEDSADANDTDSVEYFHAKVMSRRLNIGGASDVTKRTVSLSIDSAIVEDPSVTVA